MIKLSMTALFVRFAALMVLAPATSALAQAAALEESRLPTLMVTAQPCLWADSNRNEGVWTAVGDAVIGGAITQTLTNIGSALEAASAERTFTLKGSTSFDASAYADVQCIQVWSPGVASDPRTPWVADGTVIVPQPGLARPPHFFAELWLRRTGDKAYISVTPSLIQYPVSLENRRARAEGRRLRLRFEAAVPGKPATSATIPLGLQSTGTAPRWLVTSNTLFGSCPAVRASAGDARQEPFAPVAPVPTPPISIPAAGAPADDIEDATPAAAGGQQAGGSPATAVTLPCTVIGPQSEWVSNPAALAPLPVTVTVTVEEVRPRNPVLHFVSQVFNSSKDELDVALQQELIATKREEAARTAATAQATVTVTAAESLSAAVIATAGFCPALTAEPVETEAARVLRLNDLQLQAARLYALQVKANVDAELAGQSIPFPNVEGLRTRPVAASSCSAS